MVVKASLPFGEWRPDVALLDNQFAAIAENVYAGANSYLPFQGLAPLTSEQLPGRVCGLAFARTATGSYVLYAGNETALFKWAGAARWTDVSRTTGGAYTVAPGHKWSFAQFGTQLVATHIGDAVQVINVDSGTNFAALAGSPPQATSVAVIGDFLVLSGLVSNQRMIHWSAINDTTGWIIGTNLSDIQEFPDNGPVQGVAGGQIGFVIQDRGIRSMQFLPGDLNTIFNFSLVEREKGGMATFGHVFTRGVLFFVSEDGFYAIGTGQPAIGANAVNDWYRANSDPVLRDRTLAIADPHKPRVLWAFHTGANPDAYDRILIYDWSLNKWTYSTEVAQMYASLASSGIDLDTDIAGDPLDPLLDSAAASLDSYAYIGGRPVVAAVDVNGILGFLDGNNLAATMETTEAHLSPGLRTFVSAAYPQVDASAVTVAIGEREQLQDPRTFGNPQGVEHTGHAYVFSSARLHRFRVSVPANATWTHAQGVMVEAQPDGEG